MGRAVCSDEQRPFLFENNVLTDLGTFEDKAKIIGTVRAINDAGKIIGESGVLIQRPTHLLLSMAR